MPNSQSLSRRTFLGSACLGSIIGAIAAPTLARGQILDGDHGGINPPVSVPDLELMRHDGRKTTFFELVNKHVTAVQLMFTSCTTTCPIQGAIFARVQKLIPAERGLQLASLSVDPTHDTPLVLNAWLRRFKARPGWIAAAPSAGDVEVLRDFSGRGRTPSDNHSTRIQIFNRRGQLVWRTAELPDAEEIASLLQKL